ncbi:MAG: hypothetical protein JF614_12695 [Acidobacteria bacterium]|jgi:hypothetical protein|nr:hypothetical protein [Acidobacteriota bacterium]
MQQVSKIACNNNGGFVMKFRVRLGTGKLSSSWTGNYPVNQSKTMDLRELGLPPGIEVWPEVDAVLGKTKKAREHVVYDPNTENVATYRVSGTTLNISVDLLD